MFISRILERFLLPIIVTALIAHGGMFIFRADCVTEIYSNCLKSTPSESCSEVATEMCK